MTAPAKHTPEATRAIANAHHEDPYAMARTISDLAARASTLETALAEKIVKVANLAARVAELERIVERVAWQYEAEQSGHGSQTIRHELGQAARAALARARGGEGAK